MRLHKPAGFYAAYFPRLFGTFLAAAALLPSPPSPWTLLSVCALHAVGNVVLRGAACSYNDALDAPFDRLVKRCRNRPVARRAVSPRAAHGFAVVLAALWILTLSWMPTACAGPAALFAATQAVYPFCKRVTNFPQVVLGFSLALGQGIGVASVGVDPRLPQIGGVIDEAINQRRLALTCLYLSNVVNAMIYDTVYAHQDLQDDMKVGVMSMAVACRGRTKRVLSLLTVVELALLAGTGALLGFGPWYWLSAVGGTAAVLVYMLATVRLEEPADCGNWFQWILWLTGGTITSGLLIEYTMKYYLYYYAY